MRHVIFSLHPHGQSNFSATRFTAGASRSSAFWAMAALARTRARRLLFNNRMFLRHSYYLGAGVSQAHFARNQTNQGSAEEHPESDPDPGNQREYVGLKNYRALSRARRTGEIEIQIFVEPAANRDLRARLLARFVEAMLGFHDAERVRSARDVHQQLLPHVVAVLAFERVAHSQGVMPQCEGFRSEEHT